MRTSHLGSRYAAFDVPLHFSKLDLRAYLKDVYNVDVLHIRSVVIQSKIDRLKGGRGMWFRRASSKKMTVQLAKPFVYPEEVADLNPYVELAVHSAQLKSQPWFAIFGKTELLADK